MKKWKCTVCGYIHEGSAPERCPVCGVHQFRFVLQEPVPKELEKALKEAFAAESKAYIRNLAFARQAQKEGYPLAAKLFRAVAESEKVHANEYLIKYLLGVIGTTEENLQTAFENEIKAQSEGYARLIKDADRPETGGCHLEFCTIQGRGGETRQVIQRSSYRSGH